MSGDIDSAGLGFPWLVNEEASQIKKFPIEKRKMMGPKYKLCKDDYHPGIILKKEFAL